MELLYTTPWRIRVLRGCQGKVGLVLQPNPAVAIISLPKHELAEGGAKGAELGCHSKFPVGIYGRVYMADDELKDVKLCEAEEWFVDTGSLKGSHLNVSNKVQHLTDALGYP